MCPDGKVQLHCASMPQGDQQKPTKPSKDEKIEVRIDPELAKQAREKAEAHGWSLSSVIRALLALWVEEDVVHSKEVGKQNTRAPRSKKKAKKDESK